MVRIGADSQCFSYIINAMEGISEPVDELAPEKIALFRTYLYLPDTLYATPTVKKECAAIRDEAKKALHDSFFSSLFDEVRLANSDKIENLVGSYSSCHKKENDCRILTEAEVGGLDVLLTYDFRFLSSFLERSARVRLLRPSEFWCELSIPRGARPNKIPHPANPIGGHNWWRW